MNGSAADTSIQLLAIAKAVTGPLAAVDVIWKGLWTEHNITPIRLDDADRDTCLRDAISLLYGRGLLRVFATRLIDQNLVSRDFDAAIAAVLGSSAFNVQAFVNGRQLPQSAGVYNRRLLLASERVCRIEIDGNHAGTGVLVRPTLVATAAHVVDSLLIAPPAGAPAGALWQTVDDALKRLKLVFGDIDDLLDDTAQPQRRTGTAVPLHARWLAYFSPATPNEKSKALFDIENIANIAVPAGPWDLAILRLAAPPRAGQKGQELLTADPPRDPFELHVLHHPGHLNDPRGTPLLLSQGVMDRGLGNPAVRRLHTANTADGSSGAPCFDRDFRIVALHQAGPRLPGGEAARNRAVPIQHWYDKLDQLERAGDVPFLKSIKMTDGSEQPVIGRRKTQERIWFARQAIEPADRLFVMRGDAGRGKRFTEHLVRAFATKQGGIVASLDVANAQGVDAVAFASRLIGAFGANLTGGLRPSGLTTALRDINNEVAPALINELRQIGGAAQPIWLILQGFATSQTDPDASALSLIEQVIERLGEIPQLHLVLAGWKWSLPAKFAQSVEELKEPTADDVVDYLELLLMPPGEVAATNQRTALRNAVPFLLAQVNLAAADAYPQLINVITSNLAPIQRILNPNPPGNNG